MYRERNSVSNDKPCSAAIIEEPVQRAEHDMKYPLPEVSLVDRYADEPRGLRVTVVGAGISGIVAGVLLPVKVPGIKLTIFEKNADVVSSTNGHLC
jgi:hypothetical protein